MKNLFFDESGYTGSNLLDKDQPFFCYLGLDSTPELEQIFLDLKRKYNYSGKEVKGTNVVKHNAGQELLRALWPFCAERTKYFLADKKYALAAKLFEYVYEPVFADHNVIIYNSGFHIFMANFLYKYFVRSNASAESIFINFQDFIKGKKQIDFVNSINPIPTSDDPLYNFFNFCQIYKNKIASDITFDEPFDSWILDITDTGLFCLLTEFEGDGIEPLHVICNESKPLAVFKDFLDTEIGDTRKLYVEIRGQKHRLNFNLAGKIETKSSKNCISLQIVDFLAASVMYTTNHDDEFSKDIWNFAKNSMAADVSILPVGKTEYSQIELDAYFNMMKILSRTDVSYKEKLHSVWRLSRFIAPYHKFDLLKYLSKN